LELVISDLATKVILHFADFRRVFIKSSVSDKKFRPIDLIDTHLFDFILFHPIRYVFVAMAGIIRQKTTNSFSLSQGFI